MTADRATVWTDVCDADAPPDGVADGAGARRLDRDL